MNTQICEISPAPAVTDRDEQQVACSACGLSNLCLPRGLDPIQTEQFETVVNKLQPLAKGGYLFRAGTQFRSLASVRSGSFRSYVIDQEGDEHVVGFYFPGEIIGLDAIHSGVHTANVEALETSSVCSLDFDSVRELARVLPGLQEELLRVMSRNIAELEASSADLSAEQRIAGFLLSVSSRFQRRGYSSTEFNLTMGRKDIASHLRLATETVSRVLARFQDSGLIVVNRRNIKINDLPALAQLARPSNVA